ncbi:right-handed parallel beta-helix repeat-containing protein [Bradyrhizobium sp. IC3195]|uniref:right-handed parallel beta-helix repeat-containing protein n=1 Tax=Bradyrhizobium sp. IC3195 TaxID=2793804 RepID=UPI001CD80556|nr:right-handed parallel beta-helix repeat-containing protein [Bradyrhizobium sp. IC3195]MCA1467128.1 right-handed parallel beta-helix repeat-containing protein [Bradyrhizobium sp. IC3195]
MDRNYVITCLAALGLSSVVLGVPRVGLAQEVGMPASNVGFPDATNTGVPAGLVLTPHHGDLVINTPGMVISGLDIHGSVRINAPNVTLMNSKVTSSSFYTVGLKSAGGTVQNCTIDGTGTGNDGSVGIHGSGTFLNNNIFNVEDGIHPDSNSIVRGNYIHGLLASGAPHYDGIQIDGGRSNVTISHNTVINDHNQTSAVMIDNWHGAISNIRVDNNLLVGGGYTIYVDGQFDGGSISGVSITNNHMGPGRFGTTAFNRTKPIYTGNVNDGAALARSLHR